MSAILRDDPTPIQELAPNTPAGLQEVITGCLRKDREARTQSIDEVREALEALRRVYKPGTAPTISGTAARAAGRNGSCDCSCARGGRTASACKVECGDDCDRGDRSDACWCRWMVVRDAAQAARATGG